MGGAVVGGADRSGGRAGSGGGEGDEWFDERWARGDDATRERAGPGRRAAGSARTAGASRATPACARRPRMNTKACESCKPQNLLRNLRFHPRAGGPPDRRGLGQGVVRAGRVRPRGRAGAGADGGDPRAGLGRGAVGRRGARAAPCARGSHRTPLGVRCGLRFAKNASAGAGVLRGVERFLK